MKERSFYTDESDLISALKSGDHEAFRYLVEKFRNKVKRTCIGFVQSDADADDIAQDVFVEVFLSAKEFRGNSSLATWIFRIAVNKSLNFLRSSKRRKIVSLFERVGEDEKIITEPSSGPDHCPDNDLKRSDQSKAIEQAMNLLAPSQKTAFILNKYDDLSYAEVAEIMGTTVSSVESLIFRAKQNLQKSLFTFYKKNIL